MSLLDDILGSVREVTDNVVERTGKLVDVSKLKLTSAEISKEITRRYEALGRLVYDSRKSDTEISGLVDECVRSIDALYGRMDDVNSRVAKLRDKQYCATCGATVERGAIYCARCGCRVSPAAAQPESEKAEPDKAESASFTEEDLEQAAENVAEAVDNIVAEASESAQEIIDDIADAVESVTED